jgi:uncharacterized membrane protein HdeD (DUF308 family)
MKLTNWRFIVGGLLVVVGLLALVDTLTVIPFTGIMWGIIFGLAGLSFIVYLLGNHKAWWAVIPGMVLLALGIVILVDTIFPGQGDRITGFIFLGGIGAAFWMVYLMNRNFWWAIIPGGVMGTLALTVLVDEFTRVDGGFIFLFGLGITFALIAILPGLKGNRQWPLIPAGILIIISFLTLFSSLNWMSYFWAVILIVAGLFLIVRPSLFRSNKHEVLNMKEEDNVK